MKHPRSRHIKMWKQETELVDTLQEAGFAAERIRDQEGRSQGYGLEGGDVLMPLLDCELPIECKHHKDGFQKSYDAVEHAPVAVIKQNHKRYQLVIFRFPDWLALMQRAEGLKAEIARLRSELDSYRAPPISEAAE